MFDDLQNQNQPNSQSGPPQSNSFGNQNQNQSQSQLQQSQPQSAQGGFDRVSSYQAVSKEDINQRIKRLTSEQAGHAGGKKVYAIIGVVIILLLAGGGAFAGYYFWPEISAAFNKLAGKSTEQTEVSNNNADNAGGQSDKTGNAAESLDEQLLIKEEWKNCGGDADCAGTQADCCACSSSGMQTAINVNYLSQWQSAMSEKCQDIDCAAVYNCKDGKTVCENGQCVFKEDMETTASSSTELLDVNSIGSVDSSEAINASSTELTTATTTNTLSLDDDYDGLNNSDEAKYGADSNNSDTDGDGYLDGAEVKNGYNPLGEGKL